MKKTTLLLSLTAALSLPAALAADGEALFKSKPCAACHAADAKLLGPSLKEIASRYADQADAQAVLVQSITKGSQGKWGGPIPMPPNPVSEAEAQALADWVLSQK